MDKISNEDYKKAYKYWQNQIENLHKVLLDKDPMSPPKLKGLLNREVNAKERYDKARLRFLGLTTKKTE